MYVTALVLAALAAILLLAPAACHHRLPRRRTPDQVMRALNGMAAGGLASAGLALFAAVRLAARSAAHAEIERWPAHPLVGRGYAAPSAQASRTALACGFTACS